MPGPQLTGKHLLAVYVAGPARAAPTPGPRAPAAAGGGRPPPQNNPVNRGPGGPAAGPPNQSNAKST